MCKSAPVHKAGHTPGPWTICKPKHPDPRQLDDRLIVAGPSGDRLHVAEVYQYQNNSHREPNGTAIANAELIASTPDLLAENKRLREIAKEYYSSLDFELEDIEAQIGENPSKIENHKNLGSVKKRMAVVEAALEGKTEDDLPLDNPVERTITNVDLCCCCQQAKDNMSYICTDCETAVPAEIKRLREALKDCGETLDNIQSGEYNRDEMMGLAQDQYVDGGFSMPPLFLFWF